MTIHLGADHRGFRLKEHLKNYLEQHGHQLVDHGNDRYEHRDDFVDYAKRVAQAVAKSKKDRGIILCGNGVGVCIAANKVRGIRAATVASARLAKSSRTHDDANVLCLGASYVTKREAERIVDAWLATPFQSLVRRRRRLQKIKRLESV